MTDSDRTAHATKLDRIREVAMTVGEPRNAGEIADAADVARNTAAKYLQQLVETDVLTTVERGRETCYYPDSVSQYFGQIRAFVEQYSKAELTAELDAIRADIEAWQTEYDVSSPADLRATVGDDRSPEERRQRRRAAEDWEYYNHQAELIKQALQLYDGVEAARDSQLGAVS